MISPVSKTGRNEPCPCGSGRKAKRCCGIERGPSRESLARAFLSDAARDGARSVSRFSDEEFDALFDRLWELPAADLSLQVQLPKFFSPQLSRLGEAVADDDPDPRLLDAVAREIDTPFERARLARALIAKADAGAIERQLAAAALLDLASDSRMFLRTALLEAVAVKVGAASTPAGIRLAA
jgi:hypothetical protein